MKVLFYQMTWWVLVGAAFIGQNAWHSDSSIDLGEFTGAFHTWHRGRSTVVSTDGWQTRTRRTDRWTSLQWGEVEQDGTQRHTALIWADQLTSAETTNRGRGRGATPTARSSIVVWWSIRTQIRTDTRTRTGADDGLSFERQRPLTTFTRGDSSTNAAAAAVAALWCWPSSCDFTLLEFGAELLLVLRAGNPPTSG